MTRTIEKTVSIDIMPRLGDEDISLEEITQRGLSWAVRSTDNRIRVSLRRYAHEEEKTFLGTITEDKASWSKVLLSGARAGCLLSLAVTEYSSVEDGKLLKVNSSINLTKGSLQTHIVGAKFRGALALVTCKDLTSQDRLTLRHEAKNLHDPRAIMVLLDDRRHLGYIARDDNPVLHHLFTKKTDASKIFKAKCLKAGPIPKILVEWCWP